MPGASACSTQFTALASGSVKREGGVRGVLLTYARVVGHPMIIRK